MLDAEDGGATWPGNVQVSASTGSSYNGYTQIIKSITTAGTWLKVELPLTGVASPFDPSQLIQIAVEFVTYGKPEGGTFGAPQHRTFHIDTVTDGSGNPPPPPLNATFDSSLQGLASPLPASSSPTVASVRLSPSIRRSAIRPVRPSWSSRSTPTTSSWTRRSTCRRRSI